MSMLDGRCLEVRSARELEPGDVLHGAGRRCLVVAVDGSGSWRRVAVTTRSGKFRVVREVLAAREFVTEPRAGVAS